MNQVLQDLKHGAIEVADVPAGRAGLGAILIRSRASLISAGTERMLLDFGRASWLNKARQQPDKVAQVLAKIRTDGVAATMESIRAKLDQPVSVGYSNAGVVIETGRGASAVGVGERVVSNGPHADVVSVPQNLCARIPAEVTDEHAAFAVVAAIALQGVRLAESALGENVVVIGLGLIGLLTVQLLRAQGCRVLGMDFDTHKLDLATRFGAEVVNLTAGGDPVAAAEAFSRGRGIDAVVITAATKSSEPIHQAALMSRKRGRIVLVGVSGLRLSRDDFYKKELTFQVSCSYGPGRYDGAYEAGQDYPFPFVRWTAQRNFEAVLDMMACGRLDIAPLITHRFPIEKAAEAYALLFSNDPYLGIVLSYPETRLPELCSRSIRIAGIKPPRLSGQLTTQSPVVAVIGAGNYASLALLPGIKRTDAILRTIVSEGGLSAAHNGRKFGFEICTTDANEVFSDAAINAVVIATRHNSHARLVCDALQSGKRVFVEKPLSINLDQLSEVEDSYRALTSGGHAPVLMVGFNRRFAPQITRMRELLASLRGPKNMVMTINAGAIPPEHWTQNREIGGGRIVGETCHFIDLLRFLAGTPIERMLVQRGLGHNRSAPTDNASITLGFADGSVGTVHYFSGGHKSFPKEELTVFCAGRVLELSNFIKLTGYGWPRFHRMNLWRQDKGNRACIVAFLAATREGAPSPIPFEELIEVSRITILAAAEANS